MPFLYRESALKCTMNIIRPSQKNFQPSRLGWAVLCWVGCVTSDKSNTVGYCRRSGVHSEGLSVGIPPQLILYGGDGSPALVPPKIQFGWELKGHCTLDGFCMHQVLLENMADFARRDSNPDPPVRS